jgi:rod shape determining protein RodA
MASVFPVSGYVNDNRRSLAKVDWYLVLATVILLVVGFMSLYSKCSANNLPYFRKQLVNFGVGLIPFTVFAAVHPKFWQKISKLLYAISIFFLGLVLVHGRVAKGAGRWFQFGPIDFQPSELAKILTIITLATFYAFRQDRIDKPSTFFYGLLHAMVPTLLIAKEPHLGGAMVMFCMWFAVSLIAGIPLKSIFITLIAALSLIGMGLYMPSSKLIHDFQRQRLMSLLGLENDAKGSHWQVDRAEIAFGVGGVMGTGFERGEQKANGFIPEQWNDFAFTIVGEEGGLIGSTLVLLTFGFFFYRVWLTIVQSSEPYYKMLAGGIFAVLGFHTVINIAMILQLFPVVGIWLPFISYGGTAIWLCMSCVGMLVAIRRRERPILF